MPSSPAEDGVRGSGCARPLGSFRVAVWMRKWLDCRRGDQEGSEGFQMRKAEPLNGPLELGRGIGWSHIS